MIIENINEKDMGIMRCVSWLKSQDDMELKANIEKCPDKDFNGCWEYVRNNAKAQAIAGCACIEDNQVYQWCKDYFNDYEVREAEKKEQAAKQKAKEADAKANRLVGEIRKWLTEMKKILMTGKPIKDLTYLQVNEMEDKLDTNTLKQNEELKKRLEPYYTDYNEKYVNIPKPVVKEAKKADKPKITKVKEKVEVKEETNQPHQLSLFDF